MQTSEIGEINLEDIASSLYSDLALDSAGFIRYRGQLVAILKNGSDFYEPTILLESSYPSADEDLVQKTLLHLYGFLAKELSERLQPIFNLKNATNLSEQAQEIANLVLENYGVFRRSDAISQIRKLEQIDRAMLRQCGLRFGRFHIYMPHLLKPGASNLLLMLYSFCHEISKEKGEAVINAMLRGKTTIKREDEIEEIYYKLAGYDIWGEYAIRVDITERLANYVQAALNWKEGEEKPPGAYDASHFFLTSYILSMLGVNYEIAATIFKALGYNNKNMAYDAIKAPDIVRISGAVEEDPPTMDLWTFRRANKPKPKFSKKPRKVKINPNSPFSVLLKLKKEL